MSTHSLTRDTFFALSLEIYWALRPLRAGYIEKALEKFLKNVDLFENKGRFTF